MNCSIWAPGSPTANLDSHDIEVKAALLFLQMQLPVLGNIQLAIHLQRASTMQTSAVALGKEGSSLLKMACSVDFTASRALAHPAPAACSVPPTNAAAESWERCEILSLAIQLRL